MDDDPSPPVSASESRPESNTLITTSSLVSISSPVTSSSSSQQQFLPLVHSSSSVVSSDCPSSAASKVAHNQQNKCLNEKRRREQENGYIEELAELISARLSSINSLAVKPDKCAILQETVKQIRIIKQDSDDLQASEVSSSKPSLITNEVLGPLLLEALDGFLFVVNQTGVIEFVSENVHSFLNYKQSELKGESIYQILAGGDHARFSSNLLPMSAIVTNSSPSSSSSVAAAVSSASVSKSRTFNARFRVKGKKPSNNNNDSSSEEDQRKLVEEEEQLFNQCIDNGYVGSSNRTIVNSAGDVYENMQVSAVLLPYPKSESESGDMSLVCVARRMPLTDRTPSNIQVEQFSTRLDLTGKILAIDTSGVSSTYSQHLNKDMIGRPLLELCHPLDMQKVKGHLEEALRKGTYTSSPIYRLMVATDRYVCVQTKSKLFCGGISPEEYVMATHSIIRDSESTTNTTVSLTTQSNASPVSIPRPSSSDADPTPGPSSDSRGNLVVSSVASSSSEAVTTTYDYSSFSPSTNDVECSELLQDCLGLSEMFPSSSWSDYESTASEENKTEDIKPKITCVLTSVSLTSSTVSSAGSGQNNEGASSSSSVKNNISSISSPRGSSSLPFSGQLPQSSTQKPVTPTTSSESPSESATHKLRNLLTQGSEEEGNSQSSSHDILRDLLNNEDDNEDFQGIVSGAAAAVSASFTSSGNVVFSFDTTSSMTTSSSSIPSSSVPSSSSPSLSSLTKTGTSSTSSTTTIITSNSTNNNSSGNNMLRKLLNDDEQCKNYRKSSQPQEILQQLLKDNQSDTQGSPSHSSYPSTPLPTSLSELMSPQSSGPSVARYSGTGPASNKRKSVDESQPSTPATTESYKRTTSSQPKQQTQQLAGQNPMLASMLAQTPKTLPVAPITIPTSIVSQVPQERLPKNLEKKLVHTPSGQDGLVLVSSQGSLGGITSPGHQFMLPNQIQGQNQRSTLPNIPANLQGLGPVSQHRFQVQTQLEGSNPGILNNSQQQQQQQQGFLNKMLVDNNVNNRSQTVAVTLPGNQGTGIYPPPPGQQQQQQPVNQSQVRLMPVSSGSIQFPDDQQSDPMLSDILDQVWSLQQEMDVTSVVPSASVVNPSAQMHSVQSQGSHDDMLLKILDEVLEPSNPAVATPSTPGSIVTTPSTPTSDLNEKLRISEIQRQLMSCEGPSLQTRPQMFPLAPPGPGGPFANFVSHQQPPQGPPPAYPSGQLVQGQVVTGVRSRAVGPQVMQHRPQQQQFMPGMNHPGMNQQQQPSPASFANNMPVNQPRGKGMKGQTRAQLQNQKRQQMMMQQNQQMMNPNEGGHVMSDNLNDILNIKTIPPNITLQMKPRFPSVNVGGNSPLPQQSPQMNQLNAPQMNPQSQSLSPGQRGLSAPFSPIHSQSYASPSPSGPPTTNFPPATQHRMSPHPHSVYANVSSPLTGPNSPAGQIHMQTLSSPQGNFSPTSSVHQTWAPPSGPRPTAGQQNRIQAQNPMLNAQLGGPGSQVRFTSRPGVQTNTRGMSPGPRNSPIPSFPQSPGQFQPQPPPPQPGGPNARLIQLNPQTQPLIQGSQVPRTRGPSPRIMTPNESPFNSSFASGHPVVSGTPIQIEARSPSQSFMTTAASCSSQGISSEVRQKVQAIVGARSQQTQHHLQQQQNQVQHMMSPSMNLPAMSSISMVSNTFTQADIDAMDLGLSLDLDSSAFVSGESSVLIQGVFDDFPGTSSPASSSMNTPSTSSSSGVHLMRSQSINSPRMGQEEGMSSNNNNGNNSGNNNNNMRGMSANESKNKSLLQQLLSEPT